MSAPQPAFTRTGEGWVTRYSRTDTDHYQPLSGRDADLQRALGFLDRAAAPGSRYRIDLTLTAGQALLWANDRLGHGRTPYRDTADAPRLLRRGLFTLRPRQAGADR
ncbi:TauD/TfdA family dioxygenase [Actinocorallia sp. API 0066]|uniref:TauD/TfdA family dioxygenase n=1 Tax=Actinocorallia sp. API 0066 TaxID=2896846 RepID=UPI001E2EF977|nr:TauD/TfdA family dioxygenase [Actinocorallia sp. API 0066]MCD0449411.1 TauD/TfdA family dioxygenase [Actinocorallia sp. API 0066]